MRREIAGLLAGIVFTGASLFGGAPLLASDNGPEQAPGGPVAPAAPSTKPAVARISIIDGGTLVVQRGDSQKQVSGAVNAPLLPGDYISTGEGTRAEVQFDGFTMLRLSQNVQARIVTDDARSHRLQVAAGTVVAAIIQQESAVTRIDTPSVTIRMHKPADVRISVDAGGTTSVTARTGSATLETPQQNYALESGTTYVASGSAAKPLVTQNAEVGFDEFDDFNAQRDKMLYAAVDENANVPPGIAGYDNLNKYGRWVNVDPYGQVWTPNGVANDWVPYRDGQWTWNAQYGWTWVSSEAWGWVPYHYGRWFYQSGIGWCWVPPVASSAPDWQPALVSFFGFGGDGGFSSGGYASFGWVPLAPNEAFFLYNPGYLPPPVPYYPPSPPNPRPSHLPDPTHRVPPIRRTPGKPPFRNAAFGATAIDARSFHDGDFSHLHSVDMTRVSNLNVLRGPLPLVPTPNNLNFTRTPVKTPVPLSRAFSESRLSAPPAHDASSPVWSHNGTTNPGRYEPIRSYPAHSGPISAPVRSAPAWQPARSAPAPAPPSHPESSGSRGSGSRPPDR
jgi:FecR protein